MTKSHTGATWVSVRVPPDMRDELHRAATEHDRSVSAEIRRALAAYLLPTTNDKPGATDA